MGTVHVVQCLHAPPNTSLKSEDNAASTTSYERHFIHCLKSDTPKFPNNDCNEEFAAARLFEPACIHSVLDALKTQAAACIPLRSNVEVAYSASTRIKNYSVNAVLMKRYQYDLSHDYDQTANAHKTNILYRLVPDIHAPTASETFESTA